MSVYRPTVNKVNVFSEFERPEVILGLEAILYRSSAVTSASSTANSLSRLISSSIIKNWIKIDATNCNLRIIKNSSNIDITICQGNNLSPFYLAYYISQQIKTNNLECEFINNSFIICSDNETDTLSIGTATSADAKTTLGFISYSTISGSASSNTYAGEISVSGLYTGLENESYWVKVSGNNIFSTTYGNNNIYKGTVSVAGNYTASTSTTYTVTIDTTNGNSAYQGIGYCPTFSVVSTDTDDTPTNKELLFYNTWYEIGNKGVKIKFSEYPFGDDDYVQIDCLTPQTSDGVNATSNAVDSLFIVLQKDEVVAPVNLIYVDDPYTPYYKLVLQKGLELNFEAGTFEVGDTFFVKAYTGTFNVITEFNLGLTGKGDTSLTYGIRVMAKEGLYKFSWCRIGIADLDNLIDVITDHTEFKLGFLGKIYRHNTNEIITTTNPIDVVDQFGYYLDFWELDEYIDLECGNPFYASDPFYVIFKAGDDEVTQTVHPIIKFYYSYV